MPAMATHANTGATRAPRTPSERSPEYGELQRLVERVYRVSPSRPRTKLEVVAQAEVMDLGEEPMEVVALLPGGSYHRRRLCDQINSIVTAHGWGFYLGTVS